MVIKVGFTGTREGMSGRQKLEFKNYLRYLIHSGYEVEFHHGDCFGADFEADKIARELGCKVHIHPPTIADKQANCYRPGDHLYDALPYIVRDHKIVDSTDEMISAPKNPNMEELRSGTWATIRYARKQLKPLLMLGI